jgi:hypothetical protein
MKQLLTRLLAIMMASLPLLSMAQDTKTKAKKDAKEVKVKQKADKVMTGEGGGGVALQQINYPYTAEYSSNFVAGNPTHGKMILDLWKAFDDNTLDMVDNLIADTIVMQASSGEMVQGKERFMQGIKEYRNMFSTVKSTIEVWIPLRSVDRDESWVTIWGREEDTDKEGKVTTHMIHEIWKINKDGKIDFTRHYRAKPVSQ